MTNATEEACVLIVDDDAGVRESLAEVVEMIGCSAVTAGDGAEALALLSTRRPCLIFLDLLMPNVSGLEVLDRLRQAPELAEIPVVVSTSAAHLVPPGVPVLPKPIKIETAWEWIRRTCQCSPAT